MEKDQEVEIEIEDISRNGLFFSLRFACYPSKQKQLGVCNLEEKTKYRIPLSSEARMVPWKIHSGCFDNTRFFCVTQNIGKTGREIYDYYLFDLKQKKLLFSTTELDDIQCKGDKIRIAAYQELLYLGVNSGVLVINWEKNTRTLLTKNDKLREEQGFDTEWRWPWKSEVEHPELSQRPNYVSVQGDLLIIGFFADEYWKGCLTFWDRHSLKKIFQLSWFAPYVLPVWTKENLIMVNDLSLLNVNYRGWAESEEDNG
jgi:hypothetical protein